MQLLVHNLKQQAFPVSIEESSTIKDVKVKLSVDLKEDADCLKLIFKGVVLDDKSTVAECRLQNDDKLVVMTMKAKHKKERVETEPAAAPAATPESALPVAPAATPAAAPAATVAATPVSQTEAAEPSAQELEEAITRLTDMWFDRADAERALRLTFMDVDRAAELLLAGPLDDAAAAEGNSEEVEPITEVVLPPDHPLAGLAEHPMFQQMRSLIQSNPAVLPNILSLIAQENPALAEAISNHQAEFLQILLAGQAGGEVRQTQEIRLTEDEMAAIRRLEELGFETERCVEAYLVCDKNEQLAANYLFESMLEEPQQ
ncbi:MAG: uncharacterized protein KVP18_005025 [Porospora cf. gigantea A]|uniref:uncharacterized protein n=1 Tax=Porospora cf. gigantea A TaxID=2853593 RepID=UPI00355A2C36|nr:MAG: hypothetical protein KVP18_005025 [Porospora cf. gigantea A]